MKQRIEKYTLLLIWIIVLSLFISGCGESEPPIDVDAQRTGFAQTADAQATMTAEAEPTATETPVPTATFTPIPEPTETPEATATESTEPDEPVGGGSDVAQLIGQEPDDNTIIRPGEAFTVTWILENRGTATWTTNYYIEFSSGEQMGAVDKVFLWIPVPPDTNIPISVDFTAPGAEGAVRTNWKLVNADDNAFYDFHITIEVSETGGSEPVTPTETPEQTPTPES